MALQKPLLFLLIGMISLTNCQSPEEDGREEKRQVELPDQDLEALPPWQGDYSTDSLRIEELYFLYDYYEDRKLFDSAVSVCHELIELGGPLLEFRYDSSLYEKYAKAYGGIGWNLVQMGRFDESLAYANYSLELLKKRFGENHIRITEDYVVVAYNYLFRGEYDLAVEYIHKSLNVMNHIFEKNHRYFGNNFENLGTIYREKGDLEKAALYFQKTIDNRKAVGRYGGSWTYPVYALVECYLELNDPDAAARSLEEGFAVLSTTPDYDKHAFTLNLAQAKIHFHQGRFQEARRFADQFIYDFTHGKAELGYTPIAGDGYFLLGRIEKELGHPDQSIAFFRQAIEAWEAFMGAGNVQPVHALLEMARVEAGRGAFEPALHDIQLALERTIPGLKSADLFVPPSLAGLSANGPLLDILMERTAILWRAYQALGEEQYLLATWENTQQTIDYLQACREGFRGQESKIALSQNAIPVVETEMACAQELWNKYHDDRYLEAAFRSMEKVKSIVLLENLNTSFARANSNLSAELLERERELNKELALYDRLILEEQQNGARQDTVKLYYWFDKRLVVKEAHDSLAGVIRDQSPEFYELKKNLPVCSIREVQKKLQGGREMVVEYFLGDSTLTVFSISSNTFHFSHVPWGDQEAEMLDTFIRFAAKPLLQWSPEVVQSWAETGDSLFKRLFPDWEAFAVPSSLVIIPDGKLGYLPFHLLPIEAGPYSKFKDLPYLLKSCAVRYQFSSSLFLQPYKPLKKATLDYAGFAPVYQGRELIAAKSLEDSAQLAALYPEVVRDGLSKLDYNQPEVEEAASIWKGQGFSGALATEQNFKEIGPQANILHLAMHGLTNDREPLLSQLVFSGDNSGVEDGKLHNYELQNLQLSADLTVLSACNTGTGPLRRGEGVMSVSRAFRLAGCPNIVMSLWQANDRSTQDLIIRFFKELKKGEGKAAALRASSLYFLEKMDESYTHPFYWGNMMLIGDDEPIGGGLPWWVFAIVLTFFGVVVFVKFLNR